MAGRMDFDQRIAQLSPTKLALLEQKLKKNRPGPAPGPRPLPAEKRQYSPLSFSQERLWFLEQLEPDSCLYNLPAILPLPGPINPALVEESVRQIVSRHSALRTRFVVKDDQPYQVIADDPGEGLSFATMDLRVAEPQAQAARLSQALNDEIWVPFDLGTGPLLRVRLILQRDNQNLLLVVMHHIISDGWSINIFTREFRALYESAISGRAVSLPSPPQYVDYSLYQRQLLEGEKLKSLLSFWRTQLEGAPSVIGLPLDRPRPPRQSFKGALHAFTVPRSSLQKLGPLCRECGVVPFMVLLSAFKVLLFRYTQQSKIVVGTPIANRNRSELEAVIGFFTNTLVLCNSVSPEMSFRELLAQVRETTLRAHDHQELPFEKLVSELQPDRSLGHNPLFQVMFTFQNLPTEKVNATEGAPPPAPPGEGVNLDFKFSKFDLTLAMTETEGGLSAVFEYATDLFEAATIERMAAHMVRILEHVTQHPDEQIAAFSFLSEPERKLLLEQWNDTGRTWPEVLPLHRRFEQRARETPAATAVVFQGASLTYGELDRRANRVAGLLRSQGLGRGSIVGICMPRSLELVTGLFAILKAGAAYMPIEPDFPEARVTYMLADAKVSHVLTTSGCLPALSAHAVKAIALDALGLDTNEEDAPAPLVSLSPDDLAYVLFTSGSTGQPKGVMISHGAIDNRLQWMQEKYKLQATDRVMQKTPFTFDVSVWEFFWPLSVGACLIVAEPERHKESVYLVELIRRERVTCLHFVPSMLQLFLHEDLTGCESLSLIICSGEALTVDQCRRLQVLPGVRAHNLYGPTEAAVDVTQWDCGQWRDQYLSVPIGRPIANTQIYILNDQLQPSPIGVPGELYIGGHNLAKGYLNKPELTGQRFIPNPFSKEAGARLYRTGDIARFRSDGNIEYIGRVDAQVKLRGLRIELGEIESVLAQCPGVAEAVVVVHRFGAMDDRLVAYVVPKSPDTSLDASAVSAFIGKKLPSYMVPAALMALPELPLTPNGKLDRKRLPAPAAVRVSEPVAPVSDIEKELLGIWRRVLKMDALGTNDDFFALGGHSILVTQVINGINSLYHLDVPVRLVFENPTIKTLARALSELEHEERLDDSKMATAMLTRSNRRLLQTLDQLSEKQLDDILKQQFEGPRAQHFEDVRALLAWSRSYQPSSDTTPSAAPGPSSAPGAESPGATYLRCYLELAQTLAAIQSLQFGLYHPLSMSLVPEGGDELMARLRERGSQVFESYALAVKRRFCDGGSEAMTPAELRECCIQLVNMASLAAALTPQRLAGHPSHD